MDSIPIIEAEVTFLTKEDGGRPVPVILDEDWRYRPHVVVGDASERTADRRGRRLTEEYLGVAAMRLVYFPQVDYSSLVPGTTFTIREGPKAVGYGTVISRRP